MSSRCLEAPLKLHRSQGCWMARERAFKSYELLAVDPPPKELYTSFCRVCWPRSTPPQPAAPDDDDGSSSTSTEKEQEESDLADLDLLEMSPTVLATSPR